MSSCTRAEREHSQAANASWLMEIFHTIDVMLSIQMTVGQEAGICETGKFHEFGIFCEFGEIREIW